MISSLVHTYVLLITEKGSSYSYFRLVADPGAVGLLPFITDWR